MIALTGVCRFRITGELDGFTPYRRVRADWPSFSDDLSGPDHVEAFDRDAFLKTLRTYFDAVKLASDWDSLREAETELLINSLSMMCPFAVEERQALLEAPRLSDRAETLLALMRFAIASGGESDTSVQ